MDEETALAEWKSAERTEESMLRVIQAVDASLTIRSSSKVSLATQFWGTVPTEISDASVVYCALLKLFVDSWRSDEKSNDTQFLGQIESACRTCFRSVEGIVSSELQTWVKGKLERGTALDTLSNLLQPLIGVLKENIRQWFPSAVDTWVADLLVLFSVHRSTDRADKLLHFAVEAYCHSRAISEQPLDRLVDSYKTSASQEGMQQRITDALWSVCTTSISPGAVSVAIEMLNKVHWSISREPIAQLLSLCSVKERFEQDPKQEIFASALLAAARLVAAAAATRLQSQMAQQRCCEQLLEVVAQRIPQLPKSEVDANPSVIDQTWITLAEASASLEVAIDLKIKFLSYTQSGEQRSEVVKELLVILEQEPIASIAGMLKDALVNLLVGAAAPGTHNRPKTHVEDPVACQLLDGISLSISRGYPTSENIATLLNFTVVPALQSVGTLADLSHPILLSLVVLLLRCLAAIVTVEDLMIWTNAVRFLGKLIAAAYKNRRNGSEAEFAEKINDILPSVFAMRFALVEIPPVTALLELFAEILELNCIAFNSVVLHLCSRFHTDSQGFLTFDGVAPHKDACRFFKAKHLKLDIVIEAIATKVSTFESQSAEKCVRFLYTILGSPTLTEACKISLPKRLPQIFRLVEHSVLYQQPAIPDHMARYFFSMRLCVSHVSTSVFGDPDATADLRSFLERSAEELCTSLSTNGLPRKVFPATFAVVASVVIMQTSHARVGSSSLLLRWTHTLRRLPDTLLEDPHLVTATLRHLHEILIFGCFDSRDFPEEEAPILNDVAEYSLQFITTTRTAYEVFLAELVFLTWMSRGSPRQRHFAIQKHLLPHLAKEKSKSKSSGPSPVPLDVLSSTEQMQPHSLKSRTTLFPESYELLEVCSRFLWRTTYAGTDDPAPTNLWKKPHIISRFVDAPSRSWCLNTLIVTVAHDPATATGLIVVRGPSATICLESAMLNRPQGIRYHDASSPTKRGNSPEQDFLGSTDGLDERVGDDVSPVSNEATGRSPSIPDAPRFDTPPVSTHPQSGDRGMEPSVSSSSLDASHSAHPSGHQPPTKGHTKMNALKRVFQRVTSRSTMPSVASTSELAPADHHHADPTSDAGNRDHPEATVMLPPMSTPPSNKSASSGAVSPRREAPSTPNAAAQMQARIEDFAGAIVSIYPAFFSLLNRDTHLSEIASLAHVTKSSSFPRTLAALDQISCCETRKIGVLYLPTVACRKAQGLTDVDMLACDTPSKYFWDILTSMGEVTPLILPETLPAETLSKAPWMPKPSLFTGGLRIATTPEDRKANDAGEYFVRYNDVFQEVAFHVAPMMPTNVDADPACTKKKRHIGNDPVVILICDSALKCSYEQAVDAFRSEVTEVYIIVENFSGTEVSGITVRYGRKASDGVVSRLPGTVTKVVPTEEVGRRVAALAMHLSVLVKGAGYEKGQRVMNGVERLRIIRTFAESCAPSQSSSPFTAMSSSAHPPPATPSPAMGGGKANHHLYSHH